MRLAAFILWALLTGIQASGQETEFPLRQNVPVTMRANIKSIKKKMKRHRPAYCPDFYISTSTGINNNTDFAGISLDVHVKKFASVEAGVGRGLWGYRMYIGGKRYFKLCQRGWALGAGLTYNTGLERYERDMMTVAGETEPIVLNLLPQTNVFAAVYRYWNIGRKYNRIYLEFGWSQGLTANKYNQTDGNNITGNARKDIDLFVPGGPVLAIGFSLGVNN
jgi:hypothetical protein